MTQYGIRRLLEHGDFESIEIYPSKNWTVLDSMDIIPMTKIYRHIKSKILFGIRRILIKIKIFFRSGISKDKAKIFLDTDRSRFAGSFIFIGKKSK